MVYSTDRILCPISHILRSISTDTESGVIVREIDGTIRGELYCSFLSVVPEVCMPQTEWQQLGRGNSYTQTEDNDITGFTLIYFI